MITIVAVVFTITAISIVATILHIVTTLARWTPDMQVRLVTVVVHDREDAKQMISGWTEK